MGILWDATEPPPAHHCKTSPNSPRTGRVVGKSHVSTGRLCRAASRVQGWGVQGAWGIILTPTCCWILLLKYFWMSLRLVAEQRARWASSDCREDEN